MRIIAFDTETHLIRPGCPTPKMVCLSFAEYLDPEVDVPEFASEEHLEREEPIWRHPKSEAPIDPRRLRVGLLNPRLGVAEMRAWLLDLNVTIVGHNTRFDLAVCTQEDPTLLPLIFQAYEEGRILDTMVRQQLCDIATGDMKYHEDEDTGEVKHTEYGLDKLSYRLNRRWLAKEDTWRKKYALLDGVPLTSWPEAAARYALLDAIVTLDIHGAQDRLAGGPIINSEEQHRADWALYLMSLWGIRTDRKAVAELKKELEQRYAEQMTSLRPSGLIRHSPARLFKNGPRKGQMKEEENTRDMTAIRALVSKCYTDKGLAVPMTENEDKPQVSTDRKTLKNSGNPYLKILAEIGVTAKLLQTYIPILEGGTLYPINCRYNVLVETGRTSASGPNLQNPPRKPSTVREAFIPRPGYVFGFADFSGIELCTLSQVCLEWFGYSEMADALRAGQDLHLALAADMIGITYEEAKKREKEGDTEVAHYRQQAKPANFGFPGGMGGPSFKEYSEGYDIFLTEEQAKELKDAWLRKWGVMRKYFDRIAKLVDIGDPIQQLYTNRLRGGVTYCAAANGFFQGLAADGAKRALWFVARECYLENPWEEIPDPISGTCHKGRTALFGCRPVLFIHDEIGMEIPFDEKNPKAASDAAHRLSAVMVAAMKFYVRDVPVKAEPVIVRRWYKGAKAVYENEVLLPCKPVTETGADGKKKTLWVKDMPA